MGEARPAAAGKDTWQILGPLLQTRRHRVLHVVAVASSQWKRLTPPVRPGRLRPSRRLDPANV